eukprot:25966-Eustigmatos_ZCMA.PRE.1
MMRHCTREGGLEGETAAPCRHQLLLWRWQELSFCSDNGLTCRLPYSSSLCQGDTYHIPLEPQHVHPVCSISTVIKGMIALAEVPASAFGHNR